MATQAGDHRLGDSGPTSLLCHEHAPPRLAAVEGCGRDCPAAGRSVPWPGRRSADRPAVGRLPSMAKRGRHPQNRRRQGKHKRQTRAAAGHSACSPPFPSSPRSFSASFCRRARSDSIRCKRRVVSWPLSPPPSAAAWALLFHCRIGDEVASMLYLLARALER